MSTVPDTHQHVKDLIAVGFTDEQAEALVKTHIGLSGDWATKADIVVLKADIEKVRTELKADINLLRWMGGFNLAISAAILPVLIFK